MYTQITTETSQGNKSSSLISILSLNKLEWAAAVMSPRHRAVLISGKILLWNINKLLRQNTNSKHSKDNEDVQYISGFMIVYQHSSATLETQ